jgi:hypothetical protein
MGIHGYLVAASPACNDEVAYMNPAFANSAIVGALKDNIRTRHIHNLSCDQVTTPFLASS